MLAALAAQGCASTAGGGAAGRDRPYAESRRSWMPAPDFDALRERYAARDDFAALCERDRPLEAALARLAEDDWAALLRLTTPWLDRCPVDLDFHRLQAIALAQVGEPDASVVHELWTRGLLRSVLASGDGRSPATAWRVISLPEEDAVLRALGMRRVRHSRRDGGIDMVVVEAEAGTHGVYFDVAPALARERQTPARDEGD